MQEHSLQVRKSKLQGHEDFTKFVKPFIETCGDIYRVVTDLKSDKDGRLYETPFGRNLDLMAGIDGYLKDPKIRTRAVLKPLQRSSSSKQAR